MVDTKKRYVDEDGVALKEYTTPNDVRKAETFGATVEESPFVEVDVVELEGPDGPVRVTKDRVKQFEKVWAEMAEESEEVEAVEEEGDSE